MTNSASVVNDEITNFTVAWLFQELRGVKKTGTAVFEQDKLVKKVYFSRGDVVFASSNSNDDRLGEFLVRKGRITQAQLDQATGTVLKTNKKLGAVLFESGILQPRELVEQVKLQVKQIILDLFQWRTGRFRFESGQTADDIIPLQMSAADLILDGLEALDWQTIRKGLPSMSTILKPSTDPGLIFQCAHLTADQKTVLSLIDGAKKIEQVCALTGIGDFNTLKAIYVLLAVRMIEIGELKTEEERRVARAAVCEVAPIKQEEPRPSPVAATRKSIEDAFEAMKRQDDFQVLGVNNGTPEAELRKSYFRLAKQYHPDRHFEPEMADMKETLEALFSRIHDAYKNIIAGNANRSSAAIHVGGSPAGQYEQKRPEDYVENYAEKSVSAAAFFSNGMKEYESGNFWGAAEAFASASRLDPVKARYFYYSGMALKNIPRRLHEAAEKLQKAIEIDPMTVDYYLELGALYIKSGLKTKANDVYAAALRAKPGSPQVLEAMKAAGESRQEKG